MLPKLLARLFINTYIFLKDCCLRFQKAFHYRILLFYRRACILLTLHLSSFLSCFQQQYNMV